MKRFIVIGIALVLSGLIMFSTSEAANLKKDIIGKWLSVDNTKMGVQMEFLPDGTLIVTTSTSSFRDKYEHNSVAGNYKFIDDDRIRMDITQAAKVFEVFIDKSGELNMKGVTGETDKFWRVSKKARIFALKKSYVAPLRKMPANGSEGVIVLENKELLEYLGEQKSQFIKVKYRDKIGWLLGEGFEVEEIK